MPYVSGAILKLIVEYMDRHKGTEPPQVEKPLRSSYMVNVCKDKRDAKWIDRIGKNRQELYDVILAANYMDIKSLLCLGCAKVASLVKGLTRFPVLPTLRTHTRTNTLSTINLFIQTSNNPTPLDQPLYQIKSILSTDDDGETTE